MSLADYLVFSRDAPDVGERLAALTPAHWSYIDRFAHQLVARGPTLSDDGEQHTGSVHILAAPDVAAARRFADEEPFHGAGVYADTTIRRYVNVLERSMWDRVAAPDLERSTFLICEWPARPMPPQAEHAVRAAAFAEDDRWVFLGLLVSDDATESIGVCAAIDQPVEPALHALRRVLGALDQAGAAVETLRWRRGGRPTPGTTGSRPR